MADQVASLGFEVESKSVKDATQDLKALGEQAAKTSEGVGKLQPSMQTIEAAAKNAGVSVDEFRKRTAAFNAESDKLASSSKAAGSALGAIAKDAGSVAPALSAVAAASGAAAKENEAHSLSIGNLRNSLRGMSPLLNQFGGGLGDVLQYSKAARLGLEGLAVVAGGALLIALAKVSDEVERTKNRFAGLTGSAESGAKAYNAVKSAAESSGVEFASLAGFVEKALIGQEKFADKNVIYANTAEMAAKKTADMSSAAETFGKVMQSNLANAEEEGRALKALGESFGKSGTLTADALRAIRQESPSTALALANAFGSKSVKEFLADLERAPITLDDFIKRMALVKPEIDRNFDANPIKTVDQAVRELHKEWDTFVKALAETGAIGVVKDGLRGLGVGIKEISASIPDMKSQFDSAANATKSWGDIIKVTEDQNSIFGKSIEVDVGAAITKYIDFLSQGEQSAVKFEKDVVAAMGGALSAVASFSVSAGQQLASFASSAVSAAQTAASAIASISRAAGSAVSNPGNVPASGNPAGDFTGGGETVPNITAGEGDYASSVGGGTYPAFASGTDSAPGGLALINEKGGEIVNLPSGAQVIPHDVSMQMAASNNVVSATPDAASQASVTEITDAISQSTIDLTKKLAEGTDNIVKAIRALAGGVSSSAVNPATGLPIASSSSNLSTGSLAGITGQSSASGGGGGSFTVKGLNAPGFDPNSAEAKAFAAANMAAGGPAGAVGDVARGFASVSGPIAALARSISLMGQGLFGGARTSGGGSSGYRSPTGQFSGSQSYAPVDNSGFGNDSDRSARSDLDYGAAYSSDGITNFGTNSAGSNYLSDYGGSTSGGITGADTSATSYGGGSVDMGYFATGGKFKVGGLDGVDKNYIGLHVTKGETVEIKSPGTPDSIAMPAALTSPAAADASDPSMQSSGVSSMTNKYVTIQVMPGIQADSFLKSRHQIARGL